MLGAHVFATREPERVLGVNGRGHSTKYLVKWFGEEQPEWVRYRLMENHQELVREFKREQMRRYIANYTRRKREEKERQRQVHFSVFGEEGPGASEDEAAAAARRLRPTAAHRPWSAAGELRADAPLPEPKPMEGGLPQRFRLPSHRRKLHRTLHARLADCPALAGHLSLNGQLLFRLQGGDAQLFPYALVERQNPRALIAYLKAFMTC
mgnify:CR=1 FL=1